MSNSKAPAGARIALRYVGGGKWIRGVPARDLEPEEVQRFGKGALLASGLYRTAEGTRMVIDNRTRALPTTEAASASAADADSGKE